MATSADRTIALEAVFRVVGIGAAPRTIRAGVNQGYESQAMQWPAKDPDDVLDFALDWSEQLEADGTVEVPDTITTATWTVPAGLTKNSQVEEDGLVTVWLSGGEAGSRYDIGCRIVTGGGRTYDRTISLSVRQA